MAAEQSLVALALDDFPLPKRISLAESIADSVAEAIATGHMQPGERVVETALAERFRVSRVPIREALKVLHAQGILAGGGHRGFRVASFSMETIDKVFEVRLILETFLLRDAVDRWRQGLANPADLDLSIRQMEIAAKTDDRRASLRADIEFHRTICQASGNPISTTLWEGIARHVLIIFSLEAYRDSNLDAIAGQHLAFRDFILTAINKKLDLDDYRRALEDHILLVARAKRSRKA
ncbi:MAG: GntR family transcriptional regulator [Methylobacterium sp.]|nr:GntR family transcriptional regulator [Methylobacterium sp.]MCA3602383.1 GntR family transcriptional regulator [Methylobacterium sp.]MCA3610912.1 GntR family transcriptional regulator [Methylobacterium sp.]MCA3613899.1 GntR family transcriptional regulator [Methylobacterium sp.]MCA3622583.1 GntR family transcriptional regulator [Methylobacterium sp.]